MKISEMYKRGRKRLLAYHNLQVKNNKKCFDKCPYCGC